MSKPELGVKRRCLSCAAAVFSISTGRRSFAPNAAPFFRSWSSRIREPSELRLPCRDQNSVAAADPFEAETAEPEVEDEDAQDDVEIPPIEEDDLIQLTEIIDIDRDAAKPNRDEGSGFGVTRGRAVMRAFRPGHEKAATKGDLLLAWIGTGARPSQFQRLRFP